MFREDLLIFHQGAGLTVQTLKPAVTAQFHTAPFLSMRIDLLKNHSEDVTAVIESTALPCDIHFDEQTNCISEASTPVSHPLSRDVVRSPSCRWRGLLDRQLATRLQKLYSQPRAVSP